MMFNHRIPSLRQGGGIRCDRHYNYTDTEKDIAHML